MTDRADRKLVSDPQVLARDIAKDNLIFQGPAISEKVMLQIITRITEAAESFVLARDPPGKSLDSIVFTSRANMLHDWFDEFIWGYDARACRGLASRASGITLEAAARSAKLCQARDWFWPWQLVLVTLTQQFELLSADT